MLHPIGNAEGAALNQKFPDRQFLRRRIANPVVDVVGDFQRRHVFVPVLLVSFERDCAIPLLFSHSQKFFRRKRHQRDVAQKPDVSVATKRGLLRKRWQLLLELLLIFLQRIRCAFARGIQFV